MHKITKHLLAALLLAGTTLMANAAPHDLSAPTADLTSDLTDYGSSDFGRTVKLGANDQAGIANNFFTDQYTFTTSSTVEMVALLTSQVAAAEAGLKIRALNLFGANGFLLVGSQDTVNHNALDQAWGFAGGPHTLLAGTYTLQVLGYVAANAGGSYSATMAIDAVPEPATYGMLLAGLGLVVFVARRRSV
ncbi:hypothetical protein RugamoR57_54090 [Duganella caerulea]|uniref:FxDxF family PEP-CTERM protein n=1 Tax=Duganella caerulea TaxID=2885762 RepID=UPI0030EAA643